MKFKINHGKKKSMFDRKTPLVEKAEGQRGRKKGKRGVRTRTKQLSPIDWRDGCNRCPTIGNGGQRAVGHEKQIVPASFIGVERSRRHPGPGGIRIRRIKLSVPTNHAPIVTHRKLRVHADLRIVA